MQRPALRAAADAARYTEERWLDSSKASFLSRSHMSRHSWHGHCSLPRTMSSSFVPQMVSANTWSCLASAWPLACWALS